VIGSGNPDHSGIVEGSGSVEDFFTSRELQVGEDLDQVPRG
jgi:hypothetical protein